MMRSFYQKDISNEEEAGGGGIELVVLNEH